MEADDFELLGDDNKQRCIKELTELMPLRPPGSHGLKPVRKASVLITLIRIQNGSEQNGVGLLYTKRTAHLSSHAREVCFPGGRVDDSETEVEAALRETNEELGISIDNVDIWASMPALGDHTGLSDCLVIKV